MSLLACSVPSSHITSVSVARVVEQTAQSITLNTVGCAPTFDLDRGRLESDPTALLRVGREAQLDVMRAGAETFTTSLASTIPPGTYSLELLLTDGRRARFDGELEITPLDPRISDVSSPRNALGFGEAAIPLSITLANPSLCAVEGLTLVPSFSQGGVALPLEYQGQNPIHLDPTSTGTFDFMVNLGTGVTSGPIQIVVTGIGATRSGSSGCVGGIDTLTSGSRAVWTVIPADRQSIVVTALQPNPRSVAGGDTLGLAVTVQNGAGVNLTIESVDVISEPAGVALVPGSMPLMTPLASGASATATVMLAAPAVPSMRVFTLRAVVNARAGDGSLYASPAAGSPSTNVMVRPN